MQIILLYAHENQPVLTCSSDGGAQSWTLRFSHSVISTAALHRLLTMDIRLSLAFLVLFIKGN